MVWMSEKKLGKRAKKKKHSFGMDRLPFLRLYAAIHLTPTPCVFLEGILTFVFVFGGRKRGLKGKTVGKNHCFWGFYEAIPQHSEKVICSNSCELVFRFCC